MPRLSQVEAARRHTPIVHCTSRMHLGQARIHSQKRKHRFQVRKLRIATEHGNSFVANKAIVGNWRICGPLVTAFSFSAPQFGEGWGRTHRPNVNFGD
jgi:hypothetical protein